MRAHRLVCQWNGRIIQHRLVFKPHSPSRHRRGNLFDCLLLKPRNHALTLKIIESKCGFQINTVTVK